MLRLPAFALALSLVLMACPQAPITLQMVEGSEPSRCELRIPNRLLTEVANELGERLEQPMILSEDVDGRQRIEYTTEAPTCRAAVDRFAAEHDLVVQETQEGDWTVLVLAPRE